MQWKAQLKMAENTLSVYLKIRTWRKLLIVVDSGSGTGALLDI